MTTKAKIDSEIDRLTKVELVRFKQDRSGSLEVVIRSSRNVGRDPGGEEIKYVVSMMPRDASQQGEVEVQLGEVAVFEVPSWEPGVQQVVVRFGSSLEHVVEVPLMQQQESNDSTGSTSSSGSSSRLLDWYYVSMGEATDTPDITDVSSVPGVQVQLKFTATNEEKIRDVMEQIDDLQKQRQELNDKEKASKTSIMPVRQGEGGGRGSELKSSLVHTKARGEESRGKALSTWNRFSGPFAAVPKFGFKLVGILWHRRALVMFFGGAFFFHYRGDDLAV